MISRRMFLKGGAAYLGGVSLANGVVSNALDAKPSAGAGLNQLAKKNGLFFGAALNDPELTDRSSVAAITADCGIVVGQRAMKWPIMWKDQAKETPAEADHLVAFAAQHKLLLRGHALIYDAFMPAWVGKLSAVDLRKAFDRRIDYAASRWKGQVHSWDVVNEAIEPNDHLQDGLRRTVFLKKLGAGYISDAFFRARENDPSTMLCYNEYGLESSAGFAQRRRNATLRLLEDLKKRGAPIDALGVQGHLKSQLSYDDKKWRDFLSLVAQMNLKIIVSELDVYDRDFPTEIRARDQAVADLVSRFLRVTLDEKNVIGVITWGLTDAQSWMLARMRKGEAAFTRTDGSLPRPLPLDAALARKPMWYAIANAFNHAPRRS